MTNDLTLNLGNLPAHLQQSDGDNEFGAGIQTGGLDAPVLSIRGKEFRFRYQGNETSTRSRELRVILLRSRPHLSKRWYAGKYESGSVDMPACYSIDGVKPDPGGEDVQADTCSRCPRNQFGSKITPSGKKGKECSDYKRMLILPVLDGHISDTPVVFDVPIMSLRKQKTDRSDNMFLQEYTGALGRHKVPVPGIVTVLEFTDAEYPQVSFRADRTVTAEEYAKITGLRDAEETVALLEEPHAETPGPITEGPADEPPAAPDNGESDVANLLGGKVPKQEQPAAPPPPAEPPKQEAKAPEPAPEPAAEASPEPAQVEGSTTDDKVMADVRKLLGGG